MNNYIYYKTYVEPDSNGRRIEYKDKNNRLFNDKLIVTNLTSDKLPCGFVPCFNGDIGGYICTAGIKSLSYDQSQYKTKINDLSNDKLYISYRYKSVGTKNYDVVVFGNEILPVLVGAVEFSGFNVDEILFQMFDSEKMKTTEKFMKTWKIMYSRLEPCNSEKVFLSRSMSKRFKNKEDTEFSYYQMNFDDYEDYYLTDSHSGTAVALDIWRMVDAW